MAVARKGPRCLIWDIETSHNLAAVFRLISQDYSIPFDNIVQERYVISASWKVLGEPTVHAVSVLDDPARFKRNPHDDTHVLKTLYGVLSEADVIVAHNGRAYDTKFTEARMLIQGLPPLPPITQIDTLETARRRFLFNANNLDYLGKVLKVGRKVKTENGLWLKVLQGDTAAIKRMVRYNKQDVLLLERVFLKLRPYMSDHVNRQLFGGAASACPRCGSAKVQARGVHRAISNVYQRLHCQSCGGWFRAAKPTTKSIVTTRML